MVVLEARVLLVHGLKVELIPPAVGLVDFPVDGLVQFPEERKGGGKGKRGVVSRQCRGQGEPAGEEA